MKALQRHEGETEGVISAAEHSYARASTPHMHELPHMNVQWAAFVVHLLLLAAFAGPVDLKLWKTDESLRLLILKRKRNDIMSL